MKSIADTSVCLERRASRPKRGFEIPSGRPSVPQAQSRPARNVGDPAFAFVDAQSNAPFLSRPCSAFCGEQLLSSGPLIEVALAAHHASGTDDAGPVVIFDDTTGDLVNLDLRAPKAALIAQLYEQSIAMPASDAKRGKPQASDKIDNGAPPSRRRGRPKLGVVSREITLLPRHWEWLARQPGGASVMLRRLVDAACQVAGETHPGGIVRERVYRFISAVGINRSNFNETVSALLSGNRERFTYELSFWPADVSTYALRLAFGSEPKAINGAIKSE